MQIVLPPPPPPPRYQTLGGGGGNHPTDNRLHTREEGGGGGTGRPDSQLSPPRPLDNNRQPVPPSSGREPLDSTKRLCLRDKLASNSDYGIG
jgi:hypothetical protein